MTGSKKIEERYFLLNYASKIIFNSEWSKKRFTTNLPEIYHKLDKLEVIHQSTNKTKYYCGIYFKTNNANFE